MPQFKNYIDALHNLIEGVVVSDYDGNPVTSDRAIAQVIAMMHSVRDAGKKNIFIGNGGSAAIASHMAIDYSKNGRLPSLSFNDSSALTCLGNDLGYENVFSEQIKLHAHNGDLLIAISSSGASRNILRAVEQAQNSGCEVMTLSGFSPENPLRKLGKLNWYINSAEYGFVEIGHLAVCHAILDFEMGWNVRGNHPNQVIDS
jgi:D-sedoheptulose 7-phosphate isomerase